MTVKKIGVSSVLAAVVGFSVYQSVRAQGNNAYQGQNTGRFEMFFSPIARADSYMVDTSTGDVFQNQSGADGSTTFVKIQNTNPEYTTPKEGRFKMYFGPIARADQFLVDTVNGKIWEIAANANGNLILQPCKRG